MSKNKYLKIDPNRALSWSQIASFQWNKDQWYRKYVAGELPEVTKELEFGSMVDKKIQDDSSFLPKLVRYPILQHEMKCQFNDIKLIGIADTYRPKRPALRDYKTGRRPWDQKRADDTGQLTMYCLMLYWIDGIRPEQVDLYIDWLPTHVQGGKIEFIKEGDIRTFRTKRTMSQILSFGNEIMDTYNEMHEYASHRPVLDTHSYDDF